MNIESKEQSIEGMVIIPVHFKKSVGFSPFIDGVIKLQNRFHLTKTQCIAVCFSVVASECTFFLEGYL